MPNYDRIEIQKKISEVVKAATFYPVTYDETTKEPSVGVVAIDAAEIFVVVNEVASGFGLDDNYKRSFAQERMGWRFTVLVTFNVEALLEVFEQAWLASPPVIPRDVANGRPFQVRLLLEAAEYGHPPQHEAGGTHVTYQIVAEQSRR